MKNIFLKHKFKYILVILIAILAFSYESYSASKKIILKNNAEIVSESTGDYDRITNKVSVNLNEVKKLKLETIGINLNEYTFNIENKEGDLDVNYNNRIYRYKA